MIRKQLKDAAKQQIKGNIWMLLLISIIMALVSSVPLVGMILAPALSLGVIMIYLNLTHGIAPNVGDLFKGIGSLGKAWWLTILVAVFTYLWSLLLVIPGIIKSLSYSMSFYVLAENPDMTAREALNESKRLMQGHKWELFVLELSFIGWILLSMVLFFIPLIYVIPYMQATLANFYHYTKQTAQPACEYNPE